MFTLQNSAKTKLLDARTLKWTDGPTMNRGRRYHGCTTIPSTNGGNAEIIVVGGRSSEDTVESLAVASDSWVNIAQTPIRNLKAHSIVASNSPEYKLYSIGGDSSGFVSSIYGLTNSNTWEFIGNISAARGYHTSLNIPQKDIPGCN